MASDAQTVCQFPTDVNSKRQTATDSVYNSSAQNVTINSDKRGLTEADFDKFRHLWKLTLLGGDRDLTQLEIKRAVLRLSEDAESHVKTLKFSPTYIWPDLNPIHLSLNFRKSYRRLKTLTLAYSTDGTSLYRDSKVLQTILQSLDFINAEAFNSTTRVNKNENWWNYKIGAPGPLIDISMLLYNEIDAQRRRESGLTVTKMIGSLDNPSLIGSNRANMCQLVVGAGILMQDAKELSRGRMGLFDGNRGANSVFSYVESGEGFYQDGSYISHHIYPYAGGYGLTHMLAISQLAFVLQNSSFALGNTDLPLIFGAVENTFKPFVFRGMIMGNVRGRAISRQDECDSHAGHLLIQVVLRLITIAPEPYKTAYRAWALSWFADAPYADMGFSDIVIASGIQQLTSINETPTNHNTGFRLFPRSDRVVFHQQNWSATIAMSSSRTGRYETLNSENLRAFYQGDGWLQVYLDNDREHFLDNYYSTMDPFHPPGVTAGQNTQEAAPYRSVAYTSWAGGVQWETLGASSLDYLSHDKLVAAKKSWFFLPGAILALGADCSSNDIEIHTTIEARKISLQTTRLVVNGKAIEISQNSDPWQKRFASVSWAHIERVGGYLALDSASLTFNRSAREGKWTDINQYPDYEQFKESSTQHYITIYRNHSTEPEYKAYAYAILPNVTVTETQATAKYPPFFVVSNSETVQAIRFNHNQTTMATFWTAARLSDFRAMTPCQAVWGYGESGNGEYIIALSDPSQEAPSIEVKIFNENILSLTSKDPEIKTSVLDSGGVHIVVNTEGSHGKTFRVAFQLRETSTKNVGMLMYAALAVLILLLLYVAKTVFRDKARPYISWIRKFSPIERGIQYTVLPEEESSSKSVQDPSSHELEVCRSRFPR